MNLLSELNALLSTILPVETGVFSGPAPESYLVITPLAETFDLYADNLPNRDIQEARLSLFTKRNYIIPKNQLVRALLAAGITITDRRYLGREDNTKYHHFVIDVAKDYTFTISQFGGG